MSWSDAISRQLDDALIRLDALCRLYGPPREQEPAGDNLDGWNQRTTIAETPRSGRDVQ